MKEREKAVRPRSYWIIVRRVFVVLLATSGADIRLGGVSFIPACHRRNKLDAVAGCEYLDDRIRFNE